MSTLKVDTLQTTGGAGLYPAKAWVNFKGTGTVAIRDDGNVSSLTDLATGNYQVNYTSALSDANYAWTVGAGLSSTSTNNWNEYHWVIRNSGSGTPTYPPSSSSVVVTHSHVGANNNYRDSAYGLVQVMR